MSCLAHRLIIVGVVALLTLPSLGSTTLWDIDEGLNAEASREMLESGNWIVPTFNFQPRNAKPALLYWCQWAAYRHFGVSEFAARLPSALAAMLIALLVYETARKMFDAETGLLAGIVFASSIQVCLLAHAATPDMLLLLGIMLAFTLFWHGYAYDRRLWMATTALGTAFAVLAKGPVGLALPVGVMTLFLASRGELRRLWDWRLGIGIFLFLAIALPWYVLVGSETRGAFLRGFWWNENVNRFLQPLESHRGSIAFYPLVLVVGLAPWCVFVVPSVWNAWREARNDAQPARLPQRFLLIWAGLYLAFFTAAATKLPNYVLPTYPAFAIMTARMLRRWRTGELTLPTWVMPTCIASVAAVGLVTAAGLVIASGVIPLHVLKGNAIPGLQWWAVIGVVPVAATIGAWQLLRDGRRDRALGVLAAASVAYLFLMVTFPTRVVDGRKAPKQLITASGACRPTEEVRIAAYQYFQPSLVFYAKREVHQLQEEKGALDFLASPLPVYLVTPSKQWALLESRATPGCRVVARKHDLYGNCEIAVITNR